MSRGGLRAVGSKPEEKSEHDGRERPRPARPLLYLIDYEEPEPFRIYGDSDERYHLHDGSDAIPTRLAMDVMDQIQTGTKLVALAKNASGKYILTLERDSARTDVEYEQVVLALPFTLLREVDLSRAELPADKLEVINELGYGTNTKLIGQYTSKPWLTMHNASGSAFSDLSAETTWDTSRGQAGAQGILTVYLGGDAGLAADQGTPEERYVSHLPALDTIFPGTQAAYRAGSALRMHWPERGPDPLLRRTLFARISRIHGRSR